MRRGAAVLVWLAAAAASPAFSADLVVIVHPEREVALTRADVTQIYLKKRRFWAGSSDRIVPINRDSGSEERDHFVRAVLREDPRQLVVYWNRQYFRGVLPPPTLASDDAVRRFVASEPLAIGYVSADGIDETVKVVLRVSE